MEKERSKNKKSTYRGRETSPQRDQRYNKLQEQWRKWLREILKERETPGQVIEQEESEGLVHATNYKGEEEDQRSSSQEGEIVHSAMCIVHSAILKQIV